MAYEDELAETRNIDTTPEHLRADYTPTPRKPRQTGLRTTLLGTGSGVEVPSYLRMRAPNDGRIGTTELTTPMEPSSTQGVTEGGEENIYGLSSPTSADRTREIDKEFGSSYQPIDPDRRSAATSLLSMQQTRDETRALRGLPPLTGEGTGGTGAKQSFGAARKVGLNRLSTIDMRNLRVSLGSARTGAEKKKALMKAGMQAAGKYDLKARNMLVGYGDKGARGQVNRAQDLLTESLVESSLREPGSSARRRYAGISRNPGAGLPQQGFEDEFEGRKRPAAENYLRDKNYLEDEAY